jgi:hypothetical protein
MASDFIACGSMLLRVLTCIPILFIIIVVVVVAVIVIVFIE